MTLAPQFGISPTKDDIKGPNMLFLKNNFDK